MGHVLRPKGNLKGVPKAIVVASAVLIKRFRQMQLCQAGASGLDDGFLASPQRVEALRGFPGPVSLGCAQVMPKARSADRCGRAG